MAMSPNITLLAQRIRDEFNTHKGIQGALANLNTTDKSSLVAAINEVLTNAGVQINDGATNNTEAWSSTKIQAQIDTAITNLINGANGSNDTLKELADQITALAQADTGLVSATAAQSFTAPQQAQARSNIGAASAADLSTLTTNVGSTSQNYVLDFETGLL